MVSLSKFLKYTILPPVLNVLEVVWLMIRIFTEMYAEYLVEDTVRASHDLVFDQFQRLARGDLRVLDLGCGLGEFWQYGAPAGYMGVDVNDS